MPWPAWRKCPFAAVRHPKRHGTLSITHKLAGWRQGRSRQCLGGTHSAPNHPLNRTTRRFLGRKCDADPNPTILGHGLLRLQDIPKPYLVLLPKPISSLTRQLVGNAKMGLPHYKSWRLTFGCLWLRAVQPQDLPWLWVRWGEPWDDIASLRLSRKRKERTGMSALRVVAAAPRGAHSKMSAGMGWGTVAAAPRGAHINSR